MNAAEKEREVTDRDFSAYWKTLEMVTSFRYLGQEISAADENWPEVVRNLFRVRAVWKRMTQTISKEAAVPRVFRFFLKLWCRWCCSSDRRPRWSPPAR